MGYFSYHSKIQGKIKNGELEKAEFVEKDNALFMVLYFFDGTSFFIREHRFEEYLKIINSLD